LKGLANYRKAFGISKQCPASFSKFGQKRPANGLFTYLDGRNAHLCDAEPPLKMMTKVMLSCEPAHPWWFRPPLSL
jgi:hypothetical protein